VRKLKLAQYSLTGCEGCAVNLLNVVARSPEILERVEICASRIVGVLAGGVARADVAVIDGCVVTKHDEEVARAARDTADVVVALGTCACTGGINALKDVIGHEAATEAVYLRAPREPHLSEAKPLGEVIDVDYELPGCPALRSEIELLLVHLLLGKTFRLTDRAVCHDCKAAGLACLLEEGVPCLGPLTRGGCDAICIRYGTPCWGCRGLTDEPKFDEFYRAIEEHGIPWEAVKRLADVFLSKTELRRVLG